MPGSKHGERAPWLQRRAISRPQFPQKRIAIRREPLLKCLCAITIATGPRLCSVLMPTIAARVRVLHAEQLEVLFPIRTFLSERRIAKASFNPGGGALVVHPRLFHVVQIFIARDGAAAQCAIIDDPKQITFFSGFHTGFHEIPHDSN